jgi:formylglycine-generating enzyme required for sulfatase activity
MNTGRFPVENVSWHDAREFCARLTELPEEKRSRRVYRLPTEAEWEYACRGGASPMPFHVGATLSSGQANFNGNHPYGDVPRGPFLDRTTTVGSYPPNALGLFDLHGNVWEWCADWYAKDTYQKGPRQDPVGPAAGPSNRRIIRGGSWIDHGRLCRTAERGGNLPEIAMSLYGFRVVAAPADTP